MSGYGHRRLTVTDDVCYGKRNLTRIFFCRCRGLPKCVRLSVAWMGKEESWITRHILTTPWRDGEVALVSVFMEHGVAGLRSSFSSSSRHPPFLLFSFPPLLPLPPFLVAKNIWMVSRPVSTRMMPFLRISLTNPQREGPSGCYVLLKPCFICCLPRAFSLRLVGEAVGTSHAQGLEGPNHPILECLAGIPASGFSFLLALPMPLPGPRSLESRRGGGAVKTVGRSPSDYLPSQQML